MRLNQPPRRFACHNGPTIALIQGSAEHLSFCSKIPSKNFQNKLIINAETRSRRDVAEGGVAGIRVIKMSLLDFPLFARWVAAIKPHGGKLMRQVFMTAAVFTFRRDTIQTHLGQGCGWGCWWQQGPLEIWPPETDASRHYSLLHFTATLLVFTLSLWLF